MLTFVQAKMAELVTPFLLAAGYGTRLRPLTDNLPKPVIPILNVPLILLHLAILEQAGFTETIINVHHLAGMLMDIVNNRNGKISCRYSHETSILGTGGALAKVWPDSSARHLLVVNSDIVCHPPLQTLVGEHIRHGALATLFLRHDPNTDNYGRITVDETGRIVSLPTSGTPSGSPCNSGMFTGVHILSPDISDYFPARKTFCIVRDVYASLVRSQAPVFGVFTDNYWMDIGTPYRYLQVNLELLANPHLFNWPEHIECPRPDSHQCLISSTAKLDPSVTLEHDVLIGRDSHLKGYISLANVIVMPGTTLQGPMTCHNAILYQNGRIDVGVNDTA